MLKDDDDISPARKPHRSQKYSSINKPEVVALNVIQVDAVPSSQMLENLC